MSNWGLLYKPSDGGHVTVEIGSKHVDIEYVDVGQRTVRAKLSKTKWNYIQQDVKKEFNKRLLEVGLPKGSWDMTQTNFLDRFLGKELLLLAKAVDLGIDKDECMYILKTWLAMPQGERWYWYGKITNLAISESWMEALYIIMIA